MLAVKAPSVAVTVIVPLPVPEAGETESHEALSLAVQLRVPPPVLLSVRVCVAGLLPPCCAVKVRLVGLVPIAGGDGAGGVLDDFWGVRSWVSPGIEPASDCIPLPPTELLPDPEDPAAAAPAKAADVDEVCPIGVEEGLATGVIVMVDGTVVVTGATADIFGACFVVALFSSWLEVSSSSSNEVAGAGLVVPRGR